MVLFKSKAQTLASLKLKNAKYPNLFFSRLNHTNITKKILNLIKNKFDSKVAIRSSSLSEDNFKTSNAGKYDSFQILKYLIQKNFKKRLIK